MTNLVIGTGQIGTAIKQILDCDAQDKEILFSGHYDVLHICIPALENFVEVVESYRELYTPNLIIVHSTVPMGTCKQLGAVHSPCTGRHPNLLEGIKTFTKYFGGKQATEAASIFAEKGLKTRTYHDSDAMEAMKIMSTTYYGLNVMIEKEIHSWCERNNLPFDIVYTESNIDYNSGYTTLNCNQYIRPNLKHMKGGLGGHCVIQNLDLLKDFWLGDLLKEKNELYKKEQ